FRLLRGGFFLVGVSLARLFLLPRFSGLLLRGRGGGGGGGPGACGPGLGEHRQQGQRSRDGGESGHSSLLRARAAPAGASGRNRRERSDVTEPRPFVGPARAGRRTRPPRAG